MFTGIITDVGEILELEKRGDLRARIKTNYDTNGIAFGASIACDGICLTVVDFGDNWFDVEISAETVSKSVIGSCLLYTSPSPRDGLLSRMPSSA